MLNVKESKVYDQELHYKGRYLGYVMSTAGIPEYRFFTPMVGSGCTASELYMIADHLEDLNKEAAETLWKVFGVAEVSEFSQHDPDKIKIKFDTGDTCMYSDKNWPFGVVTHYKLLK